MSKGKQKILVVDDEPINIDLLINLLESDYKIFVANNGEQALQRVRANPPDLVLLDVVMPGMDGYGVCRALKMKEETKDIPVIFVTTMDSFENEEKGLILGALDYITKPFHPSIVKTRVKNILAFVRRGMLLEKLANIDGLTEIPNRRSFDVSLNEEWNRCLRASCELSVAMVDVDDFKSFNDNYGHGAGDEALKAVAQMLVKTINRPGDVVCRYGGEEFAMIFPETGTEGSKFVAEKAVKAIGDLCLPHLYSSVCSHLTISIGGAASIPRFGSSPLDLLKMADQQLYRSKEQGKNRVSWDMSND